MSDDIDKVAGQIGQSHVPSDIELKDMADMRSAKEKELQGRTDNAIANLEKLMKTPDMHSIGWIMHFGMRMIQWAQAEASEVRGMNEMSLLVLMQAQQQETQSTPCDYDKLIKDFKGKPLRWIEDRLRANKVKRVARDRRLAKFKKQLQRTDIPLPFHSLSTPFGEEGFTHEDSLSVLGNSECVSLVLRLIAVEYQRAGGSVLFLTAGKEEEPQHIAKQSMVGLNWINCCQVSSRLIETLNPIIKSTKDVPGLVIVDSLDKALVKAEVERTRSQRLERAYATFRQYQFDNGFALITGVHTDNDDKAVDPLQIYPPMLLANPTVPVGQAESDLVAGSINIVVGNDVIPRDALEKKLKAKSKE